MKSLLILSQPRSMSSECFRIACKAIPALKDPETPGQHIFAGEVLNEDYSPSLAKCKRYFPNQVPVYNLLDKYREGYVIKDVVQTGSVFTYLKAAPQNYNILVMDRRVEDVAYFMWKKGWTYPIDILGLRHTSSKNEATLVLLCYSLMKIRREYIYPLNATTITWAELTRDHNIIFNKLESLGYRCNRYNYIDEESRKIARDRRRERQTPLYKRIEKICKDIRNEL